MDQIVSSIIRGTPIGCVFALIAVGLVLTYKTSGVFNLAFGAQAYVSGAIFYELRVRNDWAIVPAFLVAVVICAPLFGLVLDRALFRYLRAAPPIAKLVTTLGLLVAIPQIVQLPQLLGGSALYAPQGIVGSKLVTYQFGRYVIDRNQLATIIATVLVVAGLTVLFRYSAVGLRMRAVVESSRMTELAGINADRVSSVSWMLSSFLAGLAGVLLAPLYASLSADDFFVLIVAAIAAAAFASLSSIPMALLGGLLLGIAQQLLANYLPPASILAAGLKPSLPFLALFLLLIFWPGLRHRRELVDPLSGVDPPPPAPASEVRSRFLTIGTYAFGGVVSAVMLVLTLFVFNSYWLSLFTQAAIYSVIFLSITVITGMAGQISLCQATFAAIGAFTTAQLVSSTGGSVLLMMVVGAVVAAAVGGLLAVPALRLGGIFLSLATLAFALFFENVLVKVTWIGGGILPPSVPRPLLGSVDFNNDKAFFLLCVVVLAIVGTLVLFVRRGTTGRYLDALRGSELAAAAIGINPTVARITAFALSAGIAGLGGGLMAMQQGAANYQANYTVFFGLFWIVVVVSLGPRTVEGAIQAAVGLVLFPEVLRSLIPWVVNHVQPWTTIGPLPLGIQFIFFGLGAITYAKHPEGVLEFNKRKSLDFVQRQIDRFSRSAAATPVEPATACPGHVVAADGGGDR